VTGELRFDDLSAEDLLRVADGVIEGDVVVLARFIR
jgi:hypothetical protein